MTTHVSIQVSGKVQGVYFRKYAKEEADRTGIKGFVRNQPDGSVYIEAEGSADQLKQFVEWCYKGSPLSKVEKVEIAKGALKNFPDFGIHR